MQNKLVTHVVNKQKQLARENAKNYLNIDVNNDLEQVIKEIRTGDKVVVTWVLNPDEIINKTASNKKQDKNKLVKTANFEGIVLWKTNDQTNGATIRVRRKVKGQATECSFPLYSPIIQNIKILNKSKNRRAVALYLRNLSSKKLKTTLKVK